jgi:MFS family permease
LLGRFGIKPAFLFGYATLSLGLVSVFFTPDFFSTVAALSLIYAGFGFFAIGLNAFAARLFTAKAALMMNVLYSFYGIGSIVGPRVAGLIAGSGNLGWHYVYLFSLPLALTFFILAIFARFPGSDFPKSDFPGSDIKAGNASPERRKNFFDALRSPLVWFFSIALGFAITVELINTNWGPLHFQDVYGLDPAADGAAFLSVFFLVFTLSRLLGGLFVERIGYMNSLLGVTFITLAIFVAGFLLGQRGIHVLPATGFFVALLSPTLIALAAVSFGRDAPVFVSAMIAVGGLINAAAQFLIGFTNRVFGPAWGYRSGIAFAVLLILALLLLCRKLRRRGRLATTSNCIRSGT